MHEQNPLKKPPKVNRKKDKTIITPEMEEKCSTSTILEKPIKMNCTVNRTSLAFGVSEVRSVEILRKLIAVAGVYPKYSVIAESFLNCSDRFNVNERLFGLFILGKVKGMATVMKLMNVNIKLDPNKMKLEEKLLSILSPRIIVEDPLLASLLQKDR